MTSPFANRTYRRLFAAQITSIAGTGITTIALALLALDLSGDHASEVLGIALALKMAVYVFAAPIMSAVSARVSRRTWLISLDLLRAGLVLCLPFVTQVWQIYALVVLINLCAASFTPVYQASIPAVLKDEEQYTKALSYSQIAYSLEQLISPAIAALLLSVVSYTVLFELNCLTFVVSASLIASITLPAAEKAFGKGSRWRNLSAGVRMYVMTPRLRAVWAMYFAVAAASAMIIVNTVVYVVSYLKLPESAMALTLAASGTGAMLGAFVTPTLLKRLKYRATMTAGCALLTACLLTGTLVPGWHLLLLLWFLIGFGLSIVQTPVGALVRMSCHDRDSAALFAANFSLSHACWFLGYLAAGLVATRLDWQATFLAMGSIALVATAIGWRLFPDPDPLEIEHTHHELAHEDQHSHDELHSPSHIEHGSHQHGPMTHTHRYVIDEHHPTWAHSHS